MMTHTGIIARFRSLILALASTILMTGCDSELNDPYPEPTGLHKLQWNPEPGPPELLVSGLQGTAGSAIGPGGELYVTENQVTGNGDPYSRISIIDPKTGERSTFAAGLPPALIPGVGGAYDIAFIGGTAYVLVTVVDDPVLFPTGLVNGIYRVDGPESFTVIADLGAFNLANPPSGFDYFVSTGVLYSIQAYRGGFLVADGHLNRILHVTLDGEVSIFRSFGNIVPTGLDVSGNSIYMAMAGPTPHLPEDGKIVTFSPEGGPLTTLASGAPLVVDVEMGRGRTVFGLAQGTWEGTPGVDDGTPALPDTGSLVQVSGDGSFTTIAEPINLPTSLEILGNKAYIINLAGEVWTVANISGPPFGS